MSNLNFDALCLIAENIEDAIELLAQNDIEVKKRNITININADEECIKGIDAELNELYNITGHKDEATGVMCEILGMNFVVSNENQSE